MEGAFLTNIKNQKVLDVHGNHDAENRNLIWFKKNGGLNQQFDIVYVDEWKGEPQKGEFSPDFGLFVERPFYIVSKMASGRYLDMINNKNFVIKVRNGRNTQEWWFDQKSYTIKTKYNSQSWNIQSSGGGQKMEIQSTNSQWF